MSKRRSRKNREEAAEAADARVAPYPSEEGEVLEALVLGLRDYVQKNGFPGVLLGVSGGIDSALCAWERTPAPTRSKATPLTRRTSVTRATAHPGSPWRPWSTRGTARRTSRPAPTSFPGSVERRGPFAYLTYAVDSPV